jgi:hypothetical protein
MMEHEHEHAGVAMARIRELSKNYARPEGTCTTYTVCFRELEEFERDLHVHVHLENTSLLTNCIELLLAMGRAQKSLFGETITDVPHRWGLRRSFVEDTFPGEVTYEAVLGHLRNALSHPTTSNRGKYPSTGYETLPDATGEISAFRFVDSPWINCGEAKWNAESPREENFRITAENFERTYHEPRGFLEVRHDSDGKFRIYYPGERYLPLFVAHMPVPG